jgi:hypothetical protein
VVMEPFQSFSVLIRTIPGIGQHCAEVIVAETGADMTVFPTAAHLASWAGTCPGSNESAGRVKSTATRPGNAYLPKGGTRRFGVVDRQLPRHLPGGEVPPHRRPTLTEEGPGSRRAHHPDRHLVDGPHRRALQRPRSRLLHPPRPRTPQGPCTQPATTSRLRRHPQPPAASA